jgi:uncharacterized cupredoxin-like copper-binding protein
VVQREWSTTPSSATIASGSVSVDVVNIGEDPHDLAIRDASGHVVFNTADVAAGAVDSETVGLAPGTYTFFCALSGHESLGMHATVTVAP